MKPETTRRISMTILTLFLIAFLFSIFGCAGNGKKKPPFPDQEQSVQGSKDTQNK